MGSEYKGGAGIGNTKLGTPCTDTLAEKFRFNKDVMLETGQISNISSFARPIADVDSSPLTFNLDKLADTFLQLDSLYFWVKCKILKGDGNPVDAADKFGIVSSFGPSFFRNIKVLLNGFELAPSSETDVPYKSYLETILSHDIRDQNTYLAASLFELDDIDNLECTSPVASQGSATPQAFINRYNRVKDSKSFDFTVPVSCDFFRANSHLAPDNKITIVATRESEPFLIQSSTAGTTGYKIKVEDIKLYYNRIRLDPTLSSKILGKPCQYLTVQTQLKKYALPAGISTYNIELYNSLLPRCLIITQVLTSASQGNYTENPFNLKHFNISNLVVRVNGQSYPPDAFRPNFDKGLYSREFTELMIHSGFFKTDRTSSITYERFAKGSSIFILDLTPDRCGSTDIHKAKPGSLEMEISWSKPLEKPITILAYACFNARYTVENTSQPAIMELI